MCFLHKYLSSLIRMSFYPTLYFVCQSVSYLQTWLLLALIGYLSGLVTPFVSSNSLYNSFDCPYIAIFYQLVSYLDRLL